ncbi:MAG: HD-GYP domain-containing protein [Actinobacteria bacterium]|nr:HD-GYP domain-containing protein [Actinomycetota bacterium]MCL5883561.1 HD-GYP domain-containing protein [Actinomycetota bacterium]
MADSDRTRQFILVGMTVLLSATAGALFFYFSSQSSWSSDIITQTVILTSIAWMAETQSVQFSKRVYVSSANLPVLLGIFFLGPAESAIIASISILAISRGKRFLKVVFMFASSAVSVMLVAELFEFLKAPFGYTMPISDITIGFVVTGILIGLLWETTDFSFTSIGAALLYKQKIITLWKNNFLRALPSQLLILGVGIVIAAVYSKAGIAAAALFFIPIFASQHVYKLLVQQKELLAEQTKLSEDLMDMNIGLAGALIMLLDSKDHYTASHSAGVAMYCRDMARMMGMSEDEQRSAHMAGLLHDLGKVGTPDSVLRKEGELTAKEWEQIKEHPTTAADVLSQLATHKEIADIIRHHQEHFDGGGYPAGIKGNEIPELSRMLAVADTYHALTSDRPYRPAKGPFEALIILRKVAGTQLDPKYVEVMAQLLKNEDLSYREGSKADFLNEFRKGRPALKLDDLRARAEEI